MKKLLLLILSLFLFTKAFSQSSEKLNEVKLNIGNTIAIASVEFGYERFLDFHQSVEGVFLINDRMNYHSEKGSREFNTSSFKLGYNYYFGEYNAGSGLYVNPFLKYRTGEFTQDRMIDPETTGKEIIDMDSFIIGFGLGYEWNFNDTFVIGPFLNLGRNFSDTVKEKFSAIEFNAGLNIGYRF
ncbi:DUF3575 domain-containing protein [Christiangramia fulva]|uniref:DUF3575 domain-containing protein n=1 Tax=Christiangramia fulva TaxID=2126553 RepID=A0A2R3Z347_9FLAO|nr:autotransporter domain-containing protein [Christiangramia fulva]AVR44684.1 DUF3575 domain-containing protein [Christiangramia fulva]